ncbi:MAG TPA: hypothetical protein VKB24_06875 [Candidatus Acidoferrum sp.]|nr:hypothetical protein [Candidatus Acidoferrum sp.]
MRRAILLLCLLPLYSAAAQDYLVGRENGRTVRDIGAEVMASMEQLPRQNGYPSGLIVLAPGKYLQSTPVIVSSPYLSITSRGPASSVQIYCSAGAAPCWKVTTSPFSVMKAGTIGGFTLNGPGPYVAGAVGIEAGGIGSVRFEDIVVQGFTGLGSVGMLWANPPGTWAERVVLDGVHLNGNSTGLKFTDPHGAADFFYWNVRDLQLNVPSDGIGIDLEQDSQVVGGFWKIVANTDVDGGTATVFLVNGSSLYGTDSGFTGSSPLVNTVHITVDNSGRTSPVTFWSVAKDAKVNVSGSVIGTSNAVYRNHIEGSFMNWIGASFIGSSMPNYTDLAVLSHGYSGNPANSYILRFQNPATTSVLSINNPGRNAAFVFDTGNQTLSNKTLSNPAVALHLNQSERAQFAGTSSCSRGAQTVRFSSPFQQTPVILVFDENTKNGVSLLGKSGSGFIVSCSGAADAFSWIAVGNPN